MPLKGKSHLWLLREQVLLVVELVRPKCCTYELQSLIVLDQGRESALYDLQQRT